MDKLKTILPITALAVAVFFLFVIGRHVLFGPIDKWDFYFLMFLGMFANGLAYSECGVSPKNDRAIYVVGMVIFVVSVLTLPVIVALVVGSIL